jgi:hypothetical protein
MIRWENHEYRNKIQFIKEVRQVAGVGLKEAKDVADLVEIELQEPVRDQTLLAEALFRLDPGRFPLPIEGADLVDYKELWESMKDDYAANREISWHMAEIEQVAQENRRKRALQDFVDKTVSGALSNRFSRVEGLDKICVYDKQRDFTTPLNVSRAQFKDMLVTAFNSWLKGI